MFAAIPTFRPAAPAQVSRLLREAGLPKAGKYSAWGYRDKSGNQQDGYIVNTSKNWIWTGHRGKIRIGSMVHVRTSVLVTMEGRNGYDLLTKALTILKLHGLTAVTGNGRELDPNERYSGSLEVWKVG